MNSSYKEDSPRYVEKPPIYSPIQPLQITSQVALLEESLKVPSGLTLNLLGEGNPQTTYMKLRDFLLCILIPKTSRTEKS